MDCGSGYDVRPEPAGSADWLETDALSDDDLFISDNETLPDATGFGARQRELNEAQAAKLAAERRPALRSPFRGTTLTELCERFGDCTPASATPCNVWCEVLETLRERERTKQRRSGFKRSVSSDGSFPAGPPSVLKKTYTVNV